MLAGLKSQAGAVALRILRPHRIGQFSERLCWLEAWEKTPGGASHNDVTKLINSHIDVEEATPGTIAGFIAKWRHVVKYARVLEVNTREKCLDDMETMLDELAKLVSAQTKASSRSGE